VVKVGLQLEMGVLRGGGTGQKDQEQDDDCHNRQENVVIVVGRPAGREGGHVWRATFWLDRRAFCAGIIVRSGLEND
jgi:hypothetical protein